VLPWKKALRSSLVTIRFSARPQELKRSSGKGSAELLDGEAPCFTLKAWPGQTPQGGFLSIRCLPLLAASASALLALAGCRCSGETGAQPTAEGEAAGILDPAPDQYWIEGKLPPSVKEGSRVFGGTLVVRLPAEPIHLSPHLLEPIDLMSTRLTLRKVYDTLMAIDSSDHPRYRLLPSAAESYEESPDHLVFTFKLRKGMRFHDGKPVSARDLVATLDKILDPKEPTTSARSYYLDVKDYRALDENTFQVSLKKPYFLFLRQIATTLPILPAHLIDKDEFRTNPIHRSPLGSGPWKFASWTLDPHQIVLERNEDYWGKKPYLEKLVFRFVPDPTVANQLFESGEFDLMTQIQPSLWMDMSRNPKLIRDFNRIRFYSKNYSWIGWNEERPFFTDPRVRRALALLFDRDTFNRNVLFDLDKPTTCHFLQDSEDCDPGLQPLPYDPVRAKAHLKEAGWVDHDGDGVLDKDGVKFRFTLLGPASSILMSKLSLVLKESYGRVGIEMDISRAEWSVFSKRVADRDFDACILMWGDTDAMSDPFQIWHSSQAKAGSNMIGFRNTRADVLIEKARVEFDPVKRSALYRELGRVFYEEQPYLWLFIRPDLDAVRKRVKGIYPSLMFYDFDKIWLEPPA
jgi:peptide/nickel transport system substrate-binding protein